MINNAYSTIFALNAMTQGKIWHVKPYSGRDSRDGKTADTAVKTLTKALSKATADRNDIVLLYAESNTLASTADYQSTTLTWSKNMVHLVGVGPYASVSPRSTIRALSTWSPSTDVPLVTWSAAACECHNVGMLFELADANAIGALNVTGERNTFFNCHVAGIGTDTQDATGAYSLKLDAAAENSFIDCHIGLDTIARGTAATAEILVDGSATRNLFKGCTIYNWIESATNAPLVRLADATSVDRWLRFKDCTFLSQSTNYGTAQNGAFKLTADLTAGYIIVEDCKTNAAKWDVDDRDKILLFNSPTPAADTAGVYRAV